MTIVEELREIDKLCWHLEKDFLLKAASHIEALEKENAELKAQLLYADHTDCWKKVTALQSQLERAENALKFYAIDGWALDLREEKQNEFTSHWRLVDTDRGALAQSVLEASQGKEK